MKKVIFQWHAFVFKLELLSMQGRVGRCLGRKKEVKEERKSASESAWQLLKGYSSVESWQECTETAEYPA